jgi:hypothetical protein
MTNNSSGGNESWPYLATAESSGREHETRLFTIPGLEDVCMQVDEQRQDAEGALSAQQKLSGLCRTSRISYKVSLSGFCFPPKGCNRKSIA